MQDAHPECHIPGHFFQQADFGGDEGIHFIGIHIQDAEHRATLIQQRQRDAGRITTLTNFTALLQTERVVGDVLAYLGCAAANGAAAWPYALSGLRPGKLHGI